MTFKSIACLTYSIFFVGISKSLIFIISLFIILCNVPAIFEKQREVLPERLRKGKKERKREMTLTLTMNMIFAFIDTKMELLCD